MKNIKKEYSINWSNSANYFYKNNSYGWMCNQIKDYKTILEIGCGSGHSTLSLLKNNHKVVVIENNQYCIDKAKELLQENGYIICDSESISTHEWDAFFLNIDLFDKKLYKKLKNINYDAVICWNVGTYWSEDMFAYYLPIMVDIGFNISNIKSNPESSYAELIQWKCCQIAKNKNIPIHLIDRNIFPITKKEDSYYVSLKNEFSFSKINYDNKKTKTLSNDGCKMVISGIVSNEDIIDVFLISVLIQ